MAWVRVDDTFYDNPKTIRVSLASAGLYFLGASYAARHLTNGVIPREWVGRRWRVAEQLVKYKLWGRERNGDYYIHHFLEWNPSAAKVKSARKAARVRMNLARTGARTKREVRKAVRTPHAHAHKDITPPTPSLSFQDLTYDQKTKVQEWIKAIARAPDEQRDQRTQQALTVLSVDMGFVPTEQVRQIMDQVAAEMQS